MSQKRDFFGFNHPFFKPLWRRIAVVGVCATWGLFELSMGQTGWALVFLGLAALACYGFFIAFDPPEDGDGSQGG